MSEMTKYQKEVARHIKGAPKELSAYVRRRLKDSHPNWSRGDDPIDCSSFVWNNSVEGYEFWACVYIKDWEAAMDNNFWKKHTALSTPSIQDYDFVNPAHYQEFSVEVIDMMTAIWGKEATAAHCEMCAFKYKLRAGSKPDQPVQRDLEKAAWYLSKAKELRDA